MLHETIKATIKARDLQRIWKSGSEDNPTRDTYLPTSIISLAAVCLGWGPWQPDRSGFKHLGPRSSLFVRHHNSESICTVAAVHDMFIQTLIAATL